MRTFFGHRPVVCLVLTASLLPSLAFAGTPADPTQVAIEVARVLEQNHYTRQKLDDAMSAKLLETYLIALDYNKLYFTQKDVDEFQKKYGATLDGSLQRGDLAPAREIFAVFKTRVEDRVAKNKELAKKKYTHDSNATVEIDRQKGPWSKDEADLDRIWAGRVEAEILQEKLQAASHSASKSEKKGLEKEAKDVQPETKPVTTVGAAVGEKARTPEEIVTRRYSQALRYTREMDDGDIVKIFLSSLAQAYDPHSEYLSPDDVKNFQIAMGLSLVGVGAVLRSDDGYARVLEVVPGGPADLDGRLKPNDRIAAVAQGDEEFEDVVDMKLDKVVTKIRGKKGTIVRLLVLPGDSTDPAQRKIVEVKRDEVKLKEQEAKAEVLDIKDAKGQPTRIGWITLPSFYATMGGDQGPKSTTKDVEALLGRLKREGIQGLVVDLRRDGGGSLEEAINLTGLFIPKGPVVLSKDTNGNVEISRDENPTVSYNGPMIVLINRLSASASEIFAAALQDYGRAVIVGDERSFGKGTVQAVVDIGQSLGRNPFARLAGFGAGAGTDAGSLKLTVQKFYRVKGGSTQLRGVESDIVLPSETDNPKFGESSLNNRLPYDEVAPVKIVDSMAATPLFLEELRARSAKRIAVDPEFAYTLENARRLKERLDANSLTLNEAARRKEIDADEQRKEAQKKERLARGPALDAQAFDLTLDDVSIDKLRPVAFDRKREKAYLNDDGDEADKKESEMVKPDAIRNETLRIMEDLILLNQQPRTASVPGEVPAENRP